MEDWLPEDRRASGVASADVMMMDVCMALHDTEDATRGFVNTAKAFDLDQVPSDRVFYGK